MKEKNLNKGSHTSHIPLHTSSNGITLIALVITIIVMLILVTVSVSAAINGGLFGYAKNAVDETQAEVDAEQGLANGEIIEQWVNGNGSTTKVTAGQRASVNSEYTSGGKTAIIPAKFTVSGKASESTIDGGLVIYLLDKQADGTEWTDEEIAEIDWENDTTLQTTYDQFVWIPIKNTTDANAQDINDMYICQGKAITNAETKETNGACEIKVVNGIAECQTAAHKTLAEDGATYKNTLMAGRLYASTSDWDFDDTYTEVYTSGTGLREPDVLTPGYAGYDGDTTYLGYLNNILGTSYAASSDFKADLQSEYNAVVKSVYENQGFYVGRYETSNMTTTDGTAVKVVAGTTSGISNINWYYMYAQQKDYATNKGLAVKSTMIQGAAYDQVMKFVNTADYSVTTVGNVGHGSSQGISGVYQTGGLNYPAGATVPYKDYSKNIYDLEGNIRAWTTEASNTIIRVYRGGDDWSSSSASCRLNGGFGSPDLSSGYGSLTQLYI